MKTFEKCNASIAALVMLVALATSPEAQAARLTANFVLAQSPTAFPLPAEVPDGTTVRVDGSSSMASINQALSDRFKAQFPGTQINLSSGSSDAALQAVLEGRADLAAIGRTLTPEEQAQGLVAVPIARSKVAIIVGADNPFTDTLTGEQFASMFRGEITDWSEVGGQPGPIRFIDRPATNDTRFALPNYPVFQSAPFQPGANTVAVAEDSLDSVISQLGNDGISYAIVDQVSNNPAVRVLPLYGTLPSDPRYPFSQPLAYVYQGPTPNPAVQAFLGFATAPATQPVIEAAKTSGAASASSATSPAPGAEPNPEPNPSVAGASSAATSNPEAGAAANGTAPPVGTASPSEALNSPSTAPATEAEGRLGVPWWWLIPIVAILGLLAWMFRSRSKPAPKTAIAPIFPDDEAIAPVEAPLGRLTEPDASLEGNRLILTPRSGQSAYAYWEVPEANKLLLRQQGGESLTLRLYDVTDIDLDYQAPHRLHEFKCSEDASDLQVPIPQDDRDYIAEIGYVTAGHQWLPLARSPQVHVPASTPTDNTSLVNSAAQPAVSTGNAASATEAGVKTASTAVARAASLPEGRLFLVPRSAEEIYAYWEVTDAQKDAIRQQGGERLVLRVYDITGVDLSDQPPRGVQQFECDENASDRRVTVPSYGDYIGTLGYLTREGRWLLVARSSPVRIRSANAPAARQQPGNHI